MLKGVNPGSCVPRDRGVCVAPPTVSKVAAMVIVGTRVSVGAAVGGMAAAVWVCWAETVDNTCARAVDWIAARSCVGAGVAPRLHALKVMAIRRKPDSQSCLRNFIFIN